MKVVFLDIDGVVCTWMSMTNPDIILYLEDDPELPTVVHRFDPESVKRLNQITDITGAKIVISSTWRILFQDDMKTLIKYLKHEGITGEVIGRTPLDRECGYINEDFPDGSRSVRGHEIQKYLNDNEVEKFTILDDSSDMVHLMPKLVYVKEGMQTGLLDWHVESAVVMLS